MTDVEFTDQVDATEQLIQEVVNGVNFQVAGAALTVALLSVMCAIPDARCRREVATTVIASIEVKVLEDA